jgi:hypoxanthine phosphoribosyltransferase
MDAIDLEEKRFIHLKHKDIEILVDKLHIQIIQDNFKPDLIVAVSRGGFVPSRILCDRLSIRRLTSIQIESYRTIGQPSEPIIVFPINSDLKGYRVLIVDDVSDTGKSILKAKQHLEEKDADIIKTATLHIKPMSSFIQDYYARLEEDWIIYPWELKETLLEIIKQLQTCGYDSTLITQKLLNIGFDKKSIKKYLIKN